MKEDLEGGIGTGGGVAIRKEIEAEAEVEVEGGVEVEAPPAATGTTGRGNSLSSFVSFSW